MMGHLGAAGIRVPDGLATTAAADRLLLETDGRQGLDSILVTPDSFLTAKRRIAETERDQERAA